MAVRSLIVTDHLFLCYSFPQADHMFQTPVYTLLYTPETPSQEARSYLATDPALIVLYKQLRDKSLQTLKGASQISPRTEWEFVIQTARLYDRMGCDLLALDLGTLTIFLPSPSPSSSPLHLLCSHVPFSSLSIIPSPYPSPPLFSPLFPSANTSTHHSPQLGVPRPTQRHAPAPESNLRSPQDAPAAEQPRGRRSAESETHG